MNIEDQNSFEIQEYKLTIADTPCYLGSVYLEMTDKLKLLCKISSVPSQNLDATFLITIKNQIKTEGIDYSIYENRLNRIFKEVYVMDQLYKCELNIEVEIIELSCNYDIYHHVLNLLMITSIVSQLELSSTLIAATCFVDNQGNIQSESQSFQLLDQRQIFLCRKLGNNEIVSFKVNGNTGTAFDQGKVFSFLFAATDKIGRQIMMYIKDKSN